MEHEQLFSEALRYQKIVSDNAFEFWDMCRNSSESIMQNTINDLNWIPETGKQSYLQLSENNRQAAAYLKSVVDSSFEQVGKVFLQVPEQVAASPKKSGPVKAIGAPAKAATTSKTKAPRQEEKDADGGQ